LRKIIGIDPGIEVTGYGIIESDGHDHRAVKFGTVLPPGGKPLYERLSYLYDDLKKIIEENSPNEMAVEEAFFSKNARTALVLGQARGVILLAGAHQDIQCFEYSPRKIKMSVVGNGNASKEQVQYMVKSLLSLPDTPLKLDITDALATALCHLNQPPEM
jgi:crossover junction endodeoxyribonuclease RuvC|tara:strand:- start:145 stop:624 length:480 start_codon:yes stop_codon:yes gene_type:complete